MENICWQKFLYGIFYITTIKKMHSLDSYCLAWGLLMVHPNCTENIIFLAAAENEKL